MDESNPELEAFRRKWREEVSAKVQDPSKSTGPSKGPRRPSPTTRISARRLSILPEEEHDHVEPPTFSGLDAPRTFDGEYAESSNAASKEPQSALEHYEKAVERENQGRLGDSLNLYRKAFRVSLNTHSIHSISDWDYRWTTASIRDTRTSISHPLPSSRNLPTQIHRMPLLQYPILPTTP